MDTAGTGVGGKVKKDGDFRKGGTGLLSLEEMNALLDHTRQIAADMADDIRHGVIEAQPATEGQWSACQYCNSAGSCPWDERIPGYGWTKLPKMNWEDLQTLLNPEAPSEEGGDNLSDL